MNKTRIVLAIVVVACLLLFVSLYRSGFQLIALNYSEEVTTTPATHSKLPSPSSPSTIHKKKPDSPNNNINSYPDDDDFFRSIRTKKSEGKTLNWKNLSMNSYLLPIKTTCNQPYGNKECVQNTSNETATSSSCCCCCWRPHPMSCVGHFKNASPPFLKNQIEKVGFYKPGTHMDACPWYDRGFWPMRLPSYFLQMNESAAEKLVNERICACPGRKGSSAPNGKNPKIGLMYLHELATMTKRLRPMPPLSQMSSRDKNGTEFATASPSAADSEMQRAREEERIMTQNAPGGVLTFAGDSITRQLFSRMVHRIRSRECSSEAELRRAAVFELQIHETAVYVATDVGDAFILAKTCEGGLDFLTSTLTGRRQRNGQASQKTTTTTTMAVNNNNGTSARRRNYRQQQILFQACFIWDNTPSSLLGTVANLHLLKNRVAALVYFPQMWYCGTHAEMFCMSANQSNGATLSVIGTAIHYNIPRVVICTNVLRQHFAYFQMNRMKQRNRQIQQLFPAQPFPKEFPWIRSMMMPMPLNSADEEAASVEKKKAVQKSSAPAPSSPSSFPGLVMLSPESETVNTFPWSNVRLYDFGSRHAALSPEQCDVVHGMCMFLPARHAHTVASVIALFGGPMCPSPGFGMCQDMGNFKLLDEIVTTVKV